MERLIEDAKKVAMTNHGVKAEDIVAWQLRTEKFSTKNKYVIVEIFTKYFLKIEVWYRKTNNGKLEYDTSIIKPIIDVAIMLEY